jgi:molecular chaperone DnaK (HSP70)
MNSPIALSVDSGGISVAALSPDGVPTLISPVDDHSFVTPLEVGYGSERHALGIAARQYLNDDPSIGWIDGLLSLLGTDATFVWDGKNCRPNDLIESFVRKLLCDVNTNWLGPSRSTIAAIPTDLSSLQRGALLRAFRKAVVDEIQLVDSSIAASVFFQPKPCEKPILICEVMNDRVQATIMQIDPDKRTMLAVRQCQIEDVDNLQRAIAQKWKASVRDNSFAGVDAEVVDRAFLVTAKTLTDSILNSGEREVQCRNVLLGAVMELSITAELLGGLGMPYFETAGHCISGCLEDAGLNWNEVEAVCFTGEFSGLTKFVESFACLAAIPAAGCSIQSNRWASVFGASLLGEPKSKERRIKSHAISLHHLGLCVRSSKEGIKRLPLLSRGTPLAAKVSRTFRTSRNDQDRIVLEMVEGPDVAFQVVKIVEIGPLFASSAHHPIDVQVQRDEQGILTVTACDGISRQSIPVRLAAFT